MKRLLRGQEAGAIMLEGMIVVILTLFVLIWILGLGFMYYQRYVTAIVTNDAAVKIASTYNNTNSDIIMGYVTTEDLAKRKLYRLFPADSQESVNEERAASYVKYALNKANFVGVVDNVEVELELVVDSLTRRHVELTTICTYKTPFGAGLEFMGMSGINTYVFKACADCTDFADYISTVDFKSALQDGTFLGGMGLVEKAAKLINSVVSTITQFAS